MLINPPNLLTGARILAIPAMIGAFYIPGDFGKWATCAIFTIAAITDYLDGYLARSLSMQSPLGRMLDPIADKLLIGAAILMLEPRDPVLYFVQRLRDEAHRFAIGTHRAKRAKALGANPPDEIPGIGPARKRALLKHFGSAKAVSRAGKEDLEAVQGISANMAQAIYDFFHERQD